MTPVNAQNACRVVRIDNSACAGTTLNARGDAILALRVLAARGAYGAFLGGSCLFDSVCVKT